MSRIFKALLLAVMVSYAVLTAARAWVWTSWDGIVRVAVAKHPGSARAQAGVAITYLLAGDIRKAIPYLQREKKLSGNRRDDAVSLKLMTGYCLAGVPAPKNVYAALDSDVMFSDNSPTVSALRWFQEVVSNNECSAFVNTERIADILQRRSVQLTGPGKFSHNWEVHYYLGRLFMKWNRKPSAYIHYQRAYRYAPESRVRELRNDLRTSKP